MKYSRLTFILFTVIFISVSCTKEETIIQVVEPTEVIPTTPSCPTGISYPDSTFYGTNILAVADSAYIVAGDFYSFAADLECGANLKIVMNGIGGNSTWWMQTASLQGWLLGPFDFTNVVQEFQSINYGSINLSIKGSTAPASWGYVRIDFYENSTTLTKSKYVYWQ